MHVWWLSFLVKQKHPIFASQPQSSGDGEVPTLLGVSKSDVVTMRHKKSSNGSGGGCHPSFKKYVQEIWFWIYITQMVQFNSPDLFCFMSNFSFQK